MCVNAIYVFIVNVVSRGYWNQNWMDLRSTPRFSFRSYVILSHLMVHNSEVRTSSAYDSKE